MCHNDTEGIGPSPNRARELIIGQICEIVSKTVPLEVMDSKTLSSKAVKTP